MEIIVTITLATLIVVVVAVLIKYLLYRKTLAPLKFLSRRLREGSKRIIILTLLLTALPVYVIISLIKRLLIPSPVNHTNPLTFLSKIFYKDPIKLFTQATGFVTGQTQAGYGNIAGVFQKVKSVFGR